MPDFSFDPLATDYQPKHAYWLARSAKVVYEDAATVQSEIQDWDLPQFKFLDNDGTQCFIAGNDKMIIVCFRGTEPKKIRDILADAEAIQTDGPGGKVHQGFARALDQVWDQVLATLAEFRQAGQSVWIAGHSLGAALATLCAARLAERDDAVNGVYTYGQPRVGDPAFSGHYDAALKSRHFRFVNNNDIVTRIPLAKFKFKSFRLVYGHVGSLVYIKSNQNLGTRISLFDRIWGRIKAAFSKDFADGLSDHDMDGYVGALEKNLGNSPF